MSSDSSGDGPFRRVTRGGAVRDPRQVCVWWIGLARGALVGLHSALEVRFGGQFHGGDWRKGGHYVWFYSTRERDDGLAAAQNPRRAGCVGPHVSKHWKR